MNISSDSESEDTIILPLTDEPSDSEIENILKKYVDTPDGTTNSCQNIIDADNEHFDAECVPQIKKVKKSDDFNINSQLIDMENLISTYRNDSFGTKNIPGEILSTKLKKQAEVENKRRAKALAKTKKLQEAEMRKVAKNVERERKKEEMDKQKLARNALRTVAKSTKPDECIKYILVELDSEACLNQYGAIVKEALQKNEINFRIKSQAMPNLITWSRKIQTMHNMLLEESEVSENNVLVIMNEKEFTEHVNKDNLTVYIQNIFSLTDSKQLTMAVVGVEKSKPNQEIAVMEAQMLTKTYFRFVKVIGDLGDLVMELTKAVAQIPFKLKKEEKYKLLSEYFNDSNKDTVKVDKNGNGLKRLWQQMLTMFPLARLETAEAITAVYPTLASLFQAYQTCDCNTEELLQDLPIRRAHGPFISSRRIGPELSRKCSNFFCSTDNKFI